MNTRLFNQRAAQRQSDYYNARSQRRMRAPAHGLLGDTRSQRKHRGSGTSLLSQARAIGLQKRGERAEIRVLADSQPDVVLQETYAAIEAIPDAQLPIAEYPETRGPEDAQDCRDWEDDDLGASDSDSSDVAGTMLRDGRRVEYRDYRKRRDRTNKTQRHWAGQMEPGISAYMEFCHNEHYGLSATTSDGSLELELTVYDIFGVEVKRIPVVDEFRSTSIIRAGFIPVAPLVHTAAFTTRTVRLYHALFVRCPRLGKQPFVKALCDMEGVAFKLYLSTQLAGAFDVYVALQNGARRRVMEELGRTAPHYRLLHACPPCQLRLEEDEPLPVRMVVGMDGNDSLRRVQRRGDAQELRAGEGTQDDIPSLPPSVERADARVGGGDYFLSPLEVDAWDESNWESINDLPQGADVSPMQRLWNEGACEERWHNAKESNTKRAAGHFLECGWFVLLCRHMMLLLACDMIRSGEQFKYPLATLNHFMSAEKEERESTGEGAPTGSLAVSYDINCKFSKTVARSPLKALALFMGFLPVIGTMHGYAHERACQLLFLMLYVVGAGIEDGEFCERYFAIANALAAVTRHQSIFHRRQSISEFAYHHDNFETYAQISKFILNNYKQALGVLATRTTLAREMRSQGITSAEVFYEWLTEEGVYLQSLCHTPPTETLEMDYLGKVMALYSCQDRLKIVRKAWTSFKVGEADTTQSTETKHRHEQENEQKLLADVHALEEKLSIAQRWKKGDENWVRVRKMVKAAEYRKALDRLEGLLVARIFEMARLNVAGTGYKMRKHLSKPFKTRSKTIQSAITAYNEAAEAMSPARPTVSWEELMEFSFLGEFDLLRDARDDVRDRHWANQKNRLLMQQFFKLIRAEEELKRLHQEIRRLVTYMAQEESEVLGRAAKVEPTNPVLAFHIREHWLERGRFNALHWQRLTAIKKLSGYDRRNNKYFARGTPVWTTISVRDLDGDAEMHGVPTIPVGEGHSGDDLMLRSFGMGGVVPAGDDDDSVNYAREDDAAVDEEDEGQLAEAVYTILSITDDE